MRLPSADFESAASASSAIPAGEERTFLIVTAGCMLADVRKRVAFETVVHSTDLGLFAGCVGAVVVAGVGCAAGIRSG
jgi:hypothetical protein